MQNTNQSIKNQLQDFQNVFQSINPLNDYDAKEYLRFLSLFVNEIEDKIAEVAVEFQQDVRIKGPYGASRWVHLEEFNDDYTSYEAGEWQASSTSC